MPEESVTPVIESILESVKKVLGLSVENDAFDPDVLIHINTVFSTLTQMGIGPVGGFRITGYDEVWSSFETSNELKTQQVRSYIPLKVKTMFDPSSNGNITSSLDRAISEMEFRLYVEEENSRYDETLVEEELSDD